MLLAVRGGAGGDCLKTFYVCSFWYLVFVVFVFVVFVFVVFVFVVAATAAAATVTVVVVVVVEFTKLSHTGVRTDVPIIFPTYGEYLTYGRKTWRKY